MSECSWINSQGLSILSTPPMFASYLMLSMALNKLWGPCSIAQAIISFTMVFCVALMIPHSLYDTTIKIQSSYSFMSTILFSRAAMPHSCHPLFNKPALSLLRKTWALSTTSLTLKCLIHRMASTSLKKNMHETCSNMPKCSTVIPFRPIWLPKLTFMPSPMLIGQDAPHLPLQDAPYWSVKKQPTVACLSAKAGISCLGCCYSWVNMGFFPSAWPWLLPSRSFHNNLWQYECPLHVYQWCSGF